MTDFAKEAAMLRYTDSTIMLTRLPDGTYAVLDRLGRLREVCPPDCPQQLKAKIDLAFDNPLPDPATYYFEKKKREGTIDLLRELNLDPDT